MVVEYVIQDTSVKYMDARTPLQEGLYYTGTTWGSGLDKAKRYPDSTSAINDAKNLQSVLPVRVLLLQIEKDRIGVGFVNF